jgi:hypothetical protein
MKHIANGEIAYGTEINVIKTSFLSLSLSLSLKGKQDVTGRNRRIQMIVYKTQSYWVSRLCPPSGILNTREYNVSETGPFSVLR